MMRTLLLSVIAATVAAAPAIAAAPLVPKPGAEPISCVPLKQIGETRVIDDRTIDFILNNRQVMRSHLPSTCPGLGTEKRFLYKTSLSSLCSTDIITVLEPPGLSRGASCGLGDFQEMVPTP